MTSSDQLVETLQALDEPQHAYAGLEQYYRGNQRLTFTAPDAMKALSARFPQLSVNYIRVAINSIAERLRVQGFDGADVWPIWLNNDLDQRSALVHREALLFGAGYVLVWANPDGSPNVSVESARQVTTLIDPGTRDTVAAVKRFHDERRNQTHAYLYLPDRVEHWRAEQAAAATAGFNLIEVLDNPLGVVPVVAFRNSDLPLDDGVSEVHDLRILVDALSKLTADLMVSSEYGARPRRYATGIELVEVPRLNEDGTPVLDTNGEPVIDTVNPFPENDRMMVSESDQAKFGQLAAADLTGYRTAVDVILGEIAAVSCLPPHYLGVLSTANPTSADALRASEAGLTAKADGKQQAFGPAWEEVMRIAVAVAGGTPATNVDVRVRWNDPATRSVAQEADAVLKMVQGGVLSRSGALRQLGYSEDQIKQELYDAERDALANANPEFSMAVTKHAELMIDHHSKTGSYAA